MTELVGVALAAGTPIAVPLTNSLNNVTSAHAALLAAYEASLPGIIVLMLFVGAVIPALLMGMHQGASPYFHMSGTVCFVFLVTLVIYVTLDMNLPSSGLIRVRHESLERLVISMSK